MISEKVKVVCPLGLHLRPAKIIAKAMTAYPCDTYILFGEKRINAKSMLSIMEACIKHDHEIEIVCDGEQESEALKEAVAIVRSGVGV